MRRTWKAELVGILLLIFISGLDSRRSSWRTSRTRSKEASYRGLRGSWPFDSTVKCEPVNTRASDAQEKNDVELRQVDGCGLNSLTGGDDPSDLNGTLHRVKNLLKRFLSEKKRNLETANEISAVHQTELGVESRVVGGEQVVPGSWPWLAAVGRRDAGPRCGGTLINDRWVLTAAHCFQDVESPCAFNVRLGATNWLSDAEGTHVDCGVEAIYRHHNHDRSNSRNDIALLKLSQPVKMDQKSNINAVCLPDSARSINEGTLCRAAGWGLIDETQVKKIPNVSREVALPVLHYGDQQGTTCGKYRPGVVLEGMICAGYPQGHKDTCMGDSGGPLIYKRDGRWFQLGLTSFGIGCARPGLPGVYTDVGYFRSWIASIIRRYS